MANFFLAEGAELEMADGDHWSMGSLENHGNAYGSGSIGLDWASPIEGNSDDVTCPIVEENIPDWSVVPFMGSDYIRINYDNIGAESYTITFDDLEPEPLPSSGTAREYFGLEPESEHTVFVTATNSRDNSITREFYITLITMPRFYRVITDTFEQFDKNRSQNCAFLARITDVLTDAPLPPHTVASIILNGFRLVRNRKGTGRVPVEGFIDIPVESSALFSALVENKYWTRDDGGYNFFHAPEQVIKYLLPVPGSYQIEYEIRLTEGNPIKICYEMLVY